MIAASKSSALAKRVSLSILGISLADGSNVCPTVLRDWEAMGGNGRGASGTRCKAAGDRAVGKRCMTLFESFFFLVTEGGLVFVVGVGFAVGLGFLVGVALESEAALGTIG